MIARRAVDKNASELIVLPNEICLGFIRIATQPRLGRAAGARTRLPTPSRHDRPFEGGLEG